MIRIHTNAFNCVYIVVMYRKKRVGTLRLLENYPLKSICTEQTYIQHTKKKEEIFMKCGTNTTSSFIFITLVERIFTKHLQLLVIKIKVTKRKCQVYMLV